MYFEAEVDFVLTSIGSDGSKIIGNFLTKTRRNRPLADENPAEYEFDYDEISQEVHLSIIKWNGKTYVSQLLNRDDRNDLKDIVKSIVPKLIHVANQSTEQKNKIEKLRNRELYISDCLADLIIGLKQEGVSSGSLSEAIQDYEDVVGSLKEAEEERKNYHFTYKSRKDGRRKNALG